MTGRVGSPRAPDQRSSMGIAFALPSSWGLMRCVYTYGPAACMLVRHPPTSCCCCRRPPAPQVQTQAAGGFAQPAASPFGSTATPAFGATAAGGLFGATTSTFGAAKPAFGQASSPGFGELLSFVGLLVLPWLCVLHLSPGLSPVSRAVGLLPDAATLPPPHPLPHPLPHPACRLRRLGSRFRRLSTRLWRPCLGPGLRRRLWSRHLRTRLWRRCLRPCVWADPQRVWQHHIRRRALRRGCRRRVWVWRRGGGGTGHAGGGLP